MTDHAPLTDDEQAAIDARHAPIPHMTDGVSTPLCRCNHRWPCPTSRLIADLRASRAVATDLAIALHHCSTFLPIFLSEHGEEGRKLQRALAVHNQVQEAMDAYCALTGTHRPDLTTRTVTPKDVHD